MNSRKTNLQKTSILRDAIQKGTLMPSVVAY